MNKKYFNKIISKSDSGVDNKKDIIINLVMFSIVIIVFVFVIDFNDFISKTNGGFFIASLIIIYIILFIVKHYFCLLRINVVNHFDKILLSLFLSNFILLNYYIIFEFYLNIGKVFRSYKVFLLIITLIALIMIIRYRIKITNIIKNNYTNFLDLKDVINNKFPNKEKLYFIEEKPAKYDLLGYDLIINKLYRSIVNCKTNETYTIGLVGDWGSGKTTILNNVESKINKYNSLNNEELIWIDTFEPLIYDDKKAMFRAMISAIISELNITSNLFELKKDINIITDTIFDYTKMDLTKFTSIKDLDICKLINNYLEVNNKRIVFIVDNIERCDKANILLILKCIFSIFNFKRFIYIISYDKKRMKKIFEKLEIDYEYIEKFIQAEYYVPRISLDKIRDINYKIINNMLKFYGTSEEEIQTLNIVIEEYSKDIKNLRELKRNINSIINMNLSNNNYLNIKDLFIINYLLLKNNDLVDLICKNKKYFITTIIPKHNYNVVSDYNSKFNTETHQFFKNLFNDEQNIKYIDLLSICFPTVKVYNDNTDENIIPNYRNPYNYISYSNDDCYKQNKDRRIFCNNYFDLYFTQTKNKFLEIDIQIKNFVKFINGNNLTKNDIEIEYVKLLSLYSDYRQKYVLENLQFYISDINKNIYCLLLIIYDKIRYCNNELVFSGISSRERAEILVANFIYKLNKKEFDKYIKHIEHDYKNLYIIKRINYWMEQDNIFFDNYNENYYTYYIDTYEKIKNEIKNERIRIYDDSNYGIHNLRCFMDNGKITKNIIKQINKHTVYKFLADIILVSYNDLFNYKINIKVFQNISISNIEKYLKQHPPINKKEKFIYEVFEKTKENKTQFDNGYVLDKYYNYDLSK